MPDQFDKNRRAEVVKNLFRTQHDISITLHKLIWSGKNHGKEMAARNWIELGGQLNTTRMLFLLGDLTFDDFAQQAKPILEKMKMLDPIVNS